MYYCLLTKCLSGSQMNLMLPTVSRYPYSFDPVTKNPLPNFGDQRIRKQTGDDGPLILTNILGIKRFL